MKHYFILLFTLVSSVCFANEIKYPVSAIPDGLKKNANVVKRMEEQKFEIVGLNEAIFHAKYALTILNPAGDKVAGLVIFYDKLRKVNSVEGSLYDGNGNFLKKIKSKDVEDRSATDEISLADDNRAKLYDFNYHTYPYTVEYEYEIKYNNTYMFPEWIPQSGEELSVESSSFTFIYPGNYTLRSRSFNYKGEPVSGADGSKQSKTWSVTNLPSFKTPYASPNWNELTTCVYFASSDFEIQGYKGSANSWQDLGKFQIALNEGKDKLPDNIVAKVNELTAGLTDEREKIKVLYNYLQKNTRYISIQLGIGGWQPFDASYVAQHGYGDCKALSNYMYSLLKAAGIKSYYSWVHAGESPNDRYLMEDFPSDQFNHIIVCVPMQKDTMWLECTSQDKSAGYMGSFTGNRKALIITENGGVLVPTPHYGLNENLQLRTIKAKIDEEGNLNMKTETKYDGTQQDYLSLKINSLSKDEVQKNLQEELELSTYNVNDFKYHETKAVLPELDEQLDISVNNYATASGRRLFIVPNILNRSERKLAQDEDRKVDFVFSDEWRDEDNAEIEIPAGYQLEAAPENVAIKTPFGTYSSSAKVEGNKIIYHRVREQFSGRFPAKDQVELGKFFSDIYKADRSKIVLVKKEA